MGICASRKITYIKRICTLLNFICIGKTVAIIIRIKSVSYPIQIKIITRSII